MNVCRILHVEDSTMQQDIIKSLFSEHQIKFAKSESEAEKVLIENEIDVILLDLLLEEGDGYHLCKKIKNNPTWSNIPILIVSSKSEATDRVLGLDIGADDYVAKPFNYLELKARVNAVFRRYKETQKNSSILKYGDLVLNLDTQTLLFHNNPQNCSLDLTKTEFKLLSYFIKNTDRIITRDQIIDSVWGLGVNVLDRSVDAKVSNLRKKLGDYGNLIQAVYGSGYKMSLPTKIKMY